MQLSKIFNNFFSSERAGGIILVICAVLSLILANSVIGENYVASWKINVAGGHVDHWINDGLMAIFFLLIGLELRRELLVGELSTLSNAMLPVFAAIGGMLFPAGIHLALNYGAPTQAGAGIPMATDIAFAIGILSLLGDRVPPALKVFLTALAVVDDLGAILVIAIFYSKGISLAYLGGALGVFLVLVLFNYLNIRNLVPYIIGGILMWYLMLHSGVHATIAGVLLAFVIDFGHGSEDAAAYRMQHYLHKPVSFIILPLFALANTAIVVQGSVTDSLASPNSLGIFLGLLLGKPVGIFLLSLLAVKAGISTRPDDMKWKHVAGLGLLGGIGFTMSIFVTLLAFDDPALVDRSKIAIIAASTVAAIAGLLLLSLTLPHKSL